MDLTITAFTSLDGVMQGPGGPDEDRSGGFDLGGWFMPYADEAFGARIDGIFARASAFLLGRTTYQAFESHWPQVTDPADEVARRLNALPKHVVSRTLDAVTWQGARLVDGDVVEAVRALKASGEGELQVHGSAGLVQTLLAEEGLVDAIHTFTVPVVLGRGKRLFGDGVLPTAFEVGDVAVSSTGVVMATARPVGRPVQQTAAVVDGADVVVDLEPV